MVLMFSIEKFSQKKPSLILKEDPTQPRLLSIVPLPQTATLSPLSLAAISQGPHQVQLV